MSAALLIETARLAVTIRAEHSALLTAHEGRAMVCGCRACESAAMTLRDAAPVLIPILLARGDAMREALKAAESWIDKAADLIPGSGYGADMVWAKIREAM